MRQLMFVLLVMTVEVLPIMHMFVCVVVVGWRSNGRVSTN